MTFSPPAPLDPDPIRSAGLPRAVISLWLALMLILLAVFIVLGTQARPRADRSKAALASIAEVFGDGAADVRRADDARRGAAAAALESLAIDLTAQGPAGTHRFVPPSALTARVLMPIEAMFDTGSGAAGNGVDSDAAGHLDRIAAAAGALPAGYRLGVVVTVPASAAAGDGPLAPSVAADLAVARAVALAGALTGRGLAADTVQTGIDDGASGAVVFNFSADAGR